MNVKKSVSHWSNLTLKPMAYISESVLSIVVKEIVAVVDVWDMLSS